nr:hypothetical protein [Tanacetum cinerariifolium]
MSWYSRCSWCEGSFNGGNCRHCTNPQTSSSDQFYCYGCGDLLEDGVHCQQCTCERCRSCLREGICFICASSNENSSIEPKSFNDTSNIFTHPPQPQYETYLCELCGNDSHYGYDCPPWRLILVLILLSLRDVSINFTMMMMMTRRELFIYVILFPPSIVITTSPPVLLIKDPEDSIIMGNKDLNTISEKESKEFIKSSVKDLVPIPSESEDTFGSDSEYVLPSFTPLSNSNEDEYFAPGDDVELLLHHDPSTLKISVASILEGFIDEPPLEENDDLFDLESKENKWKKILYDAPIVDLMTEDKVFDPRIPKKNVSPTYVSLPFTDRHYRFFTYVVRILLLYFTYLVVSHFLLSSGSEDTIFDPASPPFISHQSGTFISFKVYPNILNESSMRFALPPVSTLISR